MGKSENDHRERILWGQISFFRTSKDMLTRPCFFSVFLSFVIPDAFFRVIPESNDAHKSTKTVNSFSGQGKSSYC